MNFGIELSRFGPRRPNFYRIRSWRLKVVVSKTFNGMTPNIFVYERMAPNEVTGEIMDEFQAVASTIDLKELPVGSPAGDSSFFLRSEIEVDVFAESEHDEFWTGIQEDTSNLINLLNGEDLSQEALSWCRPIDESESLSESVSG